MNETQTTVRGTIITDPVTRRVGTDQVFTFRVASNTRYLDRTSGEWKTGGTLYFSANCWGTLAQRASGRLFKGDAVLVHGRLLTNEYEKDGRIQRDLEMRVNAIGPDMSRMEVTTKRIRFDPVEPASARDGVPGEGEETGADAMEIGSVDHDESGSDGMGSDGADADDSEVRDEGDSGLAGLRSDLGGFVGAASA